MKTIWEEDDIICGRIVCKRPLDGKFEANGNTAKWTQKIGFVCGESSSGRYVLIAMTDGMVSIPHSKKELVDILNQDNLIPMPHWWLAQVMTYLRDAYEGN